MSAGREGEHFLAVRELYEELGYPDASGRLDVPWLDGDNAELWRECGATKDGLVTELRAELVKLAWAARGEGGERIERAMRSALDGAELVMRSEIAANRPQMLATHLPGFTFMVTLPGLGREGAIKVSQRAEELLEGSAG